MKLRRPLANGSALAAVLFAAPALGADPSPPPLIPDVVITAERRPDTVQAVPIAVTALPAAALSARNLDTPLLIANTVPNMFASNATGRGSANTYTLRGLGQDQPAATFSPAVATFIDDIYFGRTNGNNFRFFDIDRAEVLRGSQGTLHGRNTIGGAIRIVNNRPSDRLGGYGEVAYGAFDRVLLRGSFDMPVNQTVQVKLSGYYLDDDGYVQNTTTGETLNDSDAAGLRGAVQLQFTDTLRWNGAATYMRNDGENLPNSLCDPNAPTMCNGRFAATGRTVNQPLGADNPIMPLGNRLDTQFYTSHFEWAGENFAVSAITGFVKTRSRSAIDLSDGRAFPTANVPAPPLNPSPLGANPVTSKGRYNLFSQEVKLIGSLLGGRVDYIAGLLYTDESNTDDRGYARIDNGTINKAAYVQIDVNATDRLKLTGSVRHTDEETRFSILDGDAGCAPVMSCLNSANLGEPTTQKADFWTPRAAISYRIADSALVYASAARGYRSGGWDAQSRNLFNIRPFDADSVWSYEGGIKGAALGGRLRVNLAAFWLEGSNLQAPMVAGFETVVQNIGGFRNRGVELELAAVPLPGLNLTAGLGYQNARYRPGEEVARQQADCAAQLSRSQVPLAQGLTFVRVPGIGPGNQDVVLSFIGAPACAAGIVDANGNVATPPRTPDVSLALGASYDWAIPAAGIILTPSVNALYLSAYESGAANATLFTGSVTGPGTTVLPANPFAGEIITGSRNPAVWQVAAALTLRTDDGNWTLALECENCLDTAFVQTSVDLVSFYNPPQVWQIRARRVF